mgnify:CR=1 FL=1
MEDIKKNRDFLLSKIDTTHKKSFFLNDKIPKLVAVSKKQEDFKIDEALACGQKIFGENRVQEAINRWQKRIQINMNLELRLIGPLQTNKVKQSLNLFDVIETIDREKIAIEIAKNFNEKTKTKSFYIQVNTGDEPQKSGIIPSELAAFYAFCSDELALRIDGLMCLPPQDEPAGAHFVLLGKLAAQLGLDKLSMGMSSDFETALALGATHIRVGTALFGARD